MMRLNQWGLLLAFLLPVFALAQNGRLRGWIYDKETDQGLPFATVKITGTQLVAVTNEQGYFLIDNIPAGAVVVEASSLGYTTQNQNITIESGRMATLKVYLAEDVVMLEGVDVRGNREELKTKVMTAVVKLSPKNIEQFSVGGDVDLVRAIQVLPGVVSTGDQGGQLFIRGGTPIQNLTLLDGMVIYNPFHSIGFFSVFDTEIIQSADIYTGGFSAQYGGRTSSVMDIKTRTANLKKISGAFSASTFTAKGLLETPIGKKKANGKAPAGLLISGKTSYLNRTSPIFYSYVENQFGNELPFSFNDIYGKFSVVGDGGSQFSAFGFHFDDRVNIPGVLENNWKANGFGFTGTVVPAASATIIDLQFAYSDYLINSNQSDALLRQSSINGFNGRMNFTYLVGKDEARYGFEMIGFKTNYNFVNTFGQTIVQEENNSEVAGYFLYKKAWTKFVFEPSIRLHYYSGLGQLSLEPRLAMKGNLTTRLRVKASGGLYSQNLVAATSDREVVNLFYGFLSGQGNTVSSFRGEPIESNLQTAWHVIAGVEYDLSDHIELQVEGYYKAFPQITNLNRNKLYDDTQANVNKPEILKKDFIIERGFATGVDVMVKADYRDFNFWAGYSLGLVRRDDGLTEYYPVFDRRHNLNLVGTWTFGKDRTWETSLRYNFGSGFPFTPRQGYGPGLDFTNPSGGTALDYDYTTSNGNLKTIYGELNSKRLPNYHRVDFTIKKVWIFTATSEFNVTAGATNLLNYENIFYVDANNVRYNQLPIMPTVSIGYRF
jgi:hypothetical protein